MRKITFGFIEDQGELKDVKSSLRKKRLKSKLRRKYVLNLLSEPQHSAKIKTPKLHKFASKGVTNLRERKLKNN